MAIRNGDLLMFLNSDSGVFEFKRIGTSRKLRRQVENIYFLTNYFPGCAGVKFPSVLGEYVDGGDEKETLQKREDLQGIQGI